MAASMRFWSTLIDRTFQRISQSCHLNSRLRKSINLLRKNLIETGFSNKQTWSKRKGILMIAFPTVQALSFGIKKEKEATTEKEKPDLYIQLVDTADKLYTENEMMKIYDLLIQHKECDNANILWRLARATRDKGKLVKDKEVQKQCVYEAFQYAERALELDDQNFACHKWYAIMLNYRGEYEGTKKQISNAFLVKTHFLKAIELNPKDATSIHSIGQWCFVFADLAWYERKLAAALFATPPTATYSEALHYFQLAEEVDPFFYSKNLLMIGKTHLRMKNYKLATDFLQKARDYPVKTPDDQEAHDESVKLLNGLGVKTD